MSDKQDQPQAKERIFQTARRLFARQGYAATGVRQIAAEAEVNLAMINYFFGSKAGLLEEIVENFFTGLKEIIARVLEEGWEPGERLRCFIRALAGYYRTNTDGMLVTITEISKDTPEIIDIKARQVSQLPVMLGPTLKEMVGDREYIQGLLPTIGPMLAAMTMSHFLLKPVIDRTGLLEADEDFYKAYPEIISNMALFGLTGLDKWIWPEAGGSKGE